jgi:hypothetical protein
MKKFILALATTAPLLIAGALRLEVSDPANNPEALARNAVLVAKITACHSPEKTQVKAFAIGQVNGTRQRVPLNVLSLGTPGTYALTREWPTHGSWEVEMIVTNPDYKDYATSVVLPIHRNALDFAAAQHYYHAATEQELLASLN